MLGVFGRKKENVSDGPEDQQTSASEEQPAVRDAEAKKNKPTPTRREQEAKRKRSLVPDDRKEAKRKYRAEMAKQRDEARRGMLEGDERYLTRRDKGPQRRFARDFVDARFSIGELLIPVAVIVLVLGIFTSRQVQLYATIIVYGLFALIIVDSFVLNYQLKGRMAEKFGGKENLERGLGFYATMRAIQLRALRTPRAKVKRGEYPS